MVRSLVVVVAAMSAGACNKTQPEDQARPPVASAGDAAVLALDATVAALVPDAAPPPPAGSAIVKLAGNAFFACALTDGGTVACWGENENGTLGVGDMPVDCEGYACTRPVKVHGITDAVDIVIGQSQACALHQEGTVSCWGGGNRGQTDRTTSQAWSSTERNESRTVSPSCLATSPASAISVDT